MGRLTSRKALLSDDRRQPAQKRCPFLSCLNVSTFSLKKKCCCNPTPAFFCANTSRTHADPMPHPLSFRPSLGANSSRRRATSSRIVRDDPVAPPGKLCFFRLQRVLLVGLVQRAWGTLRLTKARSRPLAPTHKGVPRFLLFLCGSLLASSVLTALGHRLPFFGVPKQEPLLGGVGWLIGVPVGPWSIRRFIDTEPLDPAFVWLVGERQQASWSGAMTGMTDVSESWMKGVRVLLLRW